MRGNQHTLTSYKHDFDVADQFIHERMRYHYVFAQTVDHNLHVFMFFTNAHRVGSCGTNFNDVIVHCLFCADPI